MVLSSKTKSKTLFAYFSIVLDDELMRVLILESHESNSHASTIVILSAESE